MNAGKLPEERDHEAIRPPSRADAALVVGAAGSATAAAVAGFLALACCAGPAVVALLGVAAEMQAPPLQIPFSPPS